MPAKRLLPARCFCGAPVRDVYDTDTRWPWAHYECGTDRAAPGTDPFPGGGMSQRSSMCQYADTLRKMAGLTPAKAQAMWKSQEDN